MIWTYKISQPQSHDYNKMFKSPTLAPIDELKKKKYWTLSSVLISLGLINKCKSKKEIPQQKPKSNQIN